MKYCKISKHNHNNHNNHNNQQMMVLQLNRQMLMLFQVKPQHVCLTQYLALVLVCTITVCYFSSYYCYCIIVVSAFQNSVAASKVPVSVEIMAEDLKR